MKHLLSIYLFIVVMLSIQCATTQNQQFKNPGDYYAKSDSLSQQYQKKSYHPNRTFTYLKPTLDSLALEITTILNDTKVKSKIIFKSISFYILPSGQIRYAYCGDFLKPDSTIARDPERIIAYYKPDSTLILSIEELAAKYRTDSLPNYKPFLWVTGTVKNITSGFIYSFKDTSYYISNLTGGRSKASIMRVVMREIPDLKDAYNRTLRIRHRLEGKITVKFAINEFGKIIFTEIVKSGTTINDDDLCNEFIRIIKSWKFERINKQGDVTEVVYPFVLSQ